MICSPGAETEHSMEPEPESETGELFSQDVHGPNYDPCRTIIFDWDDTILPTSFIHNVCSRIKHLTGEQRNALRSLGFSANNLLEHSLELGRVVIITNSSEGWVEYSCMVFLPILLPLFDRISVVSSRERYGSEKPTDGTFWKIRTFQDELESIREEFPEEKVSVVSIGDSIHERVALLSLGKFDPNVIVKSIKFLNLPTIPMLIMQHQMLNSSLRRLVCNTKTLDIMLASNKQKENLCIQL